MSEERTAKKRAKRLKRKKVLKAKNKLPKKNYTVNSNDEGDNASDNGD